MTTIQTSAGRDGGGSSSRPAEHHGGDWLLEEMNRQAREGIANVDNAGHLTVIGELEYDGPRCARCEDTPVEDEDVPCADCLTEIGDDHWACPRCDAHWYRSTQSHEAWAARLPVVQVAHLARHDREAAAGRVPLTYLSAVCDECGDLFEPADGETQRVCDDCDATEPDDEPHDRCPTCRGAGGWQQQHDGLIVERPRGCMTGGAA
jgi:hypothetical protein